MRRLIYIPFFLFLAAIGHSQVIVGNYNLQYVWVAPSGSCSNTAQAQLVVGPGTIYTCQSGTWNTIGGGGGGSVNSVTNVDGTLTINPTSGAVVASIALGHANTWSANQTFPSGSIASSVIAAQSANTVLGSVTAVSPSGLAVPSCSGASNGLTWITGTGFGCNTFSGTGSVTNIATTGPITGGPITTTGTIACATCVTSAAALTSNAVVIGGGSQASSTISADTTTTHALFATAGAPAFRALVAGDIPAIPISGISGLGTGVATFLATPSSANLAAAVTDETGSGALVFATAPVLAPINIDAATFYASQYAGADMGAKINTAAAACSGGNSCVIKIPAGFYAYSTAIVLGQSVVLEGEGPISSWLSYTGTAAAITLNGTSAGVRYINLQCTVACTNFINVAAGVGSAIVDNVGLTGGTSASIVIGIHGPNGIFSRINDSNISGTHFECDNAVNNTIYAVNVFGVVDNLTAIGIDMNSGCKQLNVSDFQDSYAGLHGLWMRNTLSGGVPTGLFATNLQSDQSAGGSEWVFDSTLGGSADIFVNISNSFAGSAGRNTNTTIATATAIGVDIEGGLDLTFDNIRVLDAAADGIRVGNAQIKNVKIANSFINNNNANNTAATNGITVSAAIDGLTLLGNTIGNLTGDNTGHQLFGISVTASGVTNAVIASNTLSNNTTGPISNSITAGNYILGNNYPISANGNLDIGTATATSVNKVAITTPATSATLTILNGKTLTANNSITLAGTDSTTMTFPSTSATITQTVASGTSALGTGAISSATCATVVTTTATGTATTDVIGWGFNGDPTGVTGYTPVTTGALTIFAYPSSGNVNFKVCNLTTSSITPGAVTLNWRITR